MAGSPILFSGLKAVCILCISGPVDDLTLLLGSPATPTLYRFLSINTPQCCEGIADSVRQEFLGFRGSSLVQILSS